MHTSQACIPLLHLDSFMMLDTGLREYYIVELLT